VLEGGPDLLPVLRANEGTVGDLASLSHELVNRQHLANDIALASVNDLANHGGGILSDGLNSHDLSFRVGSATVADWTDIRKSYRKRVGHQVCALKSCLVIDRFTHHPFPENIKLLQKTNNNKMITMIEYAYAM